VQIRNDRVTVSAPAKMFRRRVSRVDQLKRLCLFLPWILRETGHPHLRKFPMFISFATHSVAALACSVVLATSVNAAIVNAYSVGSGNKSATIQIDFENGNGYLVNYSWSANAHSSWDAMLAIDAALPNMSMQYDTYSFGVFLTGVTIGADTNYGQGDVEPYENYWHLWTKDSAQWEQAMFGASDRNLVNGASDAWVFGSSTVPQNIPAPGAAVVFMASTFFTRRRR
jgi:hypothetical protein